MKTQEKVRLLIVADDDTEASRVDDQRHTVRQTCLFQHRFDMIAHAVGRQTDLRRNLAVTQTAHHLFQYDQIHL